MENLSLEEIKILGNNILKVLRSPTISKQELGLMIRALGFLNACAYKSGELSPNKYKVNSVVYTFKAESLRLILKVNKKYSIPVFKDSTGDVIFFYVNGIQISFHLNRKYSNENFQVIDDLPEKRWEKVLRSYRYGNYLKYWKIKELSKNLSREELIKVDNLGCKLPKFIKHMIKYR